MSIQAFTNNSLPAGGLPTNIRPFPERARAPSFRDPVIEQLVEGLLPPDEATKVLRGFYTTALHTTLVKRLAEIRRNIETSERGRELNPLPKWRLKRVCEYIDANIEERLSLNTLATVAGVSRMYFAAQFRVATGFRPHDYLIHQRIKHAKAMLLDPNRSIVDIALSVGFQTQAHFTTIFKRVVGCTPHRWRIGQGEDDIVIASNMTESHHRAV